MSSKAHKARFDYICATSAILAEHGISAITCIGIIEVGQVYYMEKGKRLCEPCYNNFKAMSNEKK